MENNNKAAGEVKKATEQKYKNIKITAKATKQNKNRTGKPIVVVLLYFLYFCCLLIYCCFMYGKTKSTTKTTNVCKNKDTNTKITQIQQNTNHTKTTYFFFLKNQQNYHKTKHYNITVKYNKNSQIKNQINKTIHKIYKNNTQ